MLEIIKSFFSPVGGGGANKLRFTEWKYTKEGGFASRV